MLITGATSGLGLALAKLASKKGYQVIACGRNQGMLDELARKHNMLTLCFDVNDEGQTQLALGDVKADICVLNAGVCEYVDVDTLQTTLFQRVFATNFFGVVNCVSSLLPSLQKGSQLVIIDSLARLLPFSRSQAYGASKAALHYFSSSLAVDLTNKGIRVQTVSPGFISTPLTDKNDFAMPMLMPSEEAAVKLLKGIENKSSTIYFPYKFALLMRVCGLLPSITQRWLARRFI
jgi:NAD(P)-dependent dehydrogenase (short-subunit alcohol dehydrogenase family)